MEEQKSQLSPVPEAEVKFKIITDRIVREIINEDINEPLVEISGYDLQINFNMDYLKSLEDIDAACQGIADMFRNIIIDKLLEHNSANKPNE